MSYITERYSMEEYNGRSFNIIQCGWQRCDPNHSQGPKFYKDYSITFVLNGKGSYKIRNRIHEIRAGEGFLILPGLSTYYIADSKEPWEYIYALFSGPDVPSLLEAAGLDADHVCFRYGDDQEIRAWLNDMLDSCRSNNSFGYDALGYFYLCLSKLIRQSAAEWQKALPGDVLVKNSISFMRSHYDMNITVADVARSVGVDRSYLHRLFLKSMNCTPHAWLLNYRLEQGARFLLQTEYSISEVANSIGFFDASHFSHSFKKKYGCSPLEYQKKQKREIAAQGDKGTVLLSRRT